MLQISLEEHRNAIFRNIDCFFFLCSSGTFDRVGVSFVVIRCSVFVK